MFMRYTKLMQKYLVVALNVFTKVTKYNHCLGGVTDRLLPTPKVWSQMLPEIVSEVEYLKVSWGRVPPGPLVSITSLANKKKTKNIQNT